MKNDPLTTVLLQADDPDSFSSVSLGDLVAVDDATIEEHAKIAAQKERRTTIEKPVEIAGIEWVHITGREGESVRFEEFRDRAQRQPGDNQLQPRRQDPL